MPIITRIVCDGCQAVKGEVNHWFAITVGMQGAYIQPLEAALREHGLERQYFCGRLCLLEALNRWMDTVVAD
jgi:predicted Fe-S protein YdhL (DUF1289 family)